MRDWEREVSRTLATKRLSAADREEMSRELAGYLEDLCNDARGRGLDEAAAIERASAELHDDKKLGAKLYRARKENNMNDRTKRLWLPGLTMLLASATLLAGLYPYYGVLFLRVSTSHPAAYWHFSMYNPWLLILPLLGAAGAYWSRRAGSNRGVQAAVGFFPLLVFLGSFLAMVHFRFAAIPTVKWFAVDILNWVAIPGAALLLGVLPFLRGASNHRRMA